MEWLTIIALTCTPLKATTPDPYCEKKLKECIEWVYDQEEVKAKGLDKFTIAVWFQTNSKARLRICKLK